MFDVIFSSALAQEVAGQAGTAADQPNPLMSFMPFIFIFIIFYFLMIKPQKKKLQEENNLLANLAKGDEIFTKSGILGTIQGITDKVVTLEVCEGVKFKVLRSQVGGHAKKIFEKKNDKKGEKKIENKNDDKKNDEKK